MQFLPVIFAPFIGSFLGVLIRRLPEGQPIALARSVCVSCGRVLGVRDLVPVASFLLLRGRCRTCHAPIGVFHLAVELAAVAVALWAALMFAEPALAEPAWVWASCVLGWTLLALGWIDVEHMMLPDVLTLPLLLAGLGATLLLDPQDIGDHALGAVVGYLVFRAIAAGYRAWRGRTGLGGGDAKLLAAAGAWLGWQALPSVVLEASVAGIAAALIAHLLGRRVSRTTALPFGPFIAAAVWLVWLYGVPLPG
jgi:leader peptidase (prepilin peptidase)/N-methyltransferase